MSVDITLRKSDGQVLAYEIFPSVIASNARLSYDQAQALIDSAPHDLIDAFRKEAAPFGAVELDDEMILQLAEKVKAAKALSERLYERRYAQAAWNSIALKHVRFLMIRARPRASAIESGPKPPSSSKKR